MPWSSSPGCDRNRSGMKMAVASDAAATPKLSDICCIVLAIVLAMLASAAATSAKARVFMLVYCNEAAAPKRSARATMRATQVPAPIVAKRAMAPPITIVFARSTRR